ncbi:hypothetical protein THAOC_08138 [Thalassiosira oceanica]|uniref:Uncharacterized protein n=1 Tax=Thalassiosira oceanica TaxID=159749 RepID=K0TAN1_THAOC|nr:hypothetical protein THAOC_08138 [Thalassiosira oceanica]|eukprot:EJK70496.1 hypothetical protein THAOC_08138 [Thalassiosira oceanica]
MAALHHALSSSSMGPDEALETEKYLVEQCGASVVLSVVLRDAAGRTPYEVASSQAELVERQGPAGKLQTRCAGAYGAAASWAGTP